MIPLMLAQAPPAAGSAGQVATIILSVCAGGGFAAVVNWLAGRRKVGADAVKVYTETSLLLLKPMQAELTRLEARARLITDQLTIATSLLRQHHIDWPAEAPTPPPWS